MSTAATEDNWGDGGAYENYMVRWSRKVAPEFMS